MNRLEELLLLWQDESIGADELAELKTLLASPAGRAQVAKDFFLTGVVLESLRVQRVAGEIEPAPPNLPAPAKPAHRLAWAAGVAVALLLGLLAFLWQMPSAPPAPVFAQFEQVQGETFVVSQERQHPAQAGQILVPGQGIATKGADSEAVVQMDDARLTLGGDTVVFTTAAGNQVEAGATRLVLEQGELFVQVSRSLKRKKMSVETPLGTAIAEMEDTALHISDVAGVVVVRGEATFIHKATGKSIRIQGGQYVATTAEGDLYAAQVLAGNGQVWARFPQSGLDTVSLVFSVAFSPDGKRLAAAGRTPESSWLGPVDGPEPPTELRGEHCVRFSPDGQLLATSDQNSVLLYEAATGTLQRTLKNNDSRVRATCLAFAPDGNTLAIGRVSWRDQIGLLELWDLPTGTLRQTLRGHPAAITCLAYSPDGKRLASGSLDKTVVLWDPTTGQEQTRILMMPTLVVWSLAFAPDGRTLAIATGPQDFRLRPPGEVKLWDVATETVRATLQGHSRAVTSVVYAPDGQTLITGSADTTVRFWDLRLNRQYGMLKGHQAAPGFEALSVALSPDGNWLATVSFDRTVKLWKTTKNAAGSRISAQAHRPPWNALAAR